MKVSIECKYCGHRWTEIIYHQSALDGKICKNGNCRDRNLIVRDLKDKIDYYADQKLIVKNNKSKIDYYVGSPPFPEMSNDDRWRQFGMD